jgi:DNA-binding ferritin-like protein (Dps family)
MGMKAKDLIELNNEKRKLLTTENETAYSDMLIYIRLAKVPEYQTEELLIEILDHLIEAQQEEKSAYDIFGDDLQAYCDELIASLPKQSVWEQLSIPFFITSYLLAIYFAISSVIAFVFPLFSNEARFKLVHIDFIFLFVFTISIHLVIRFIFSFINTDLFNKSTNTLKHIGHFFIRHSPWLLFIGISFLFIKKPYTTLQISPWISTLLAISCYALYKLFFKKEVLEFKKEE